MPDELYDIYEPSEKKKDCVRKGDRVLYKKKIEHLHTTSEVNNMQYLHAMVRVLDVDKSLDFYINKLGLKEISRKDHEQGKFTLIFLATGPNEPMIELTHNWDQTEPYSGGRNFGHLAFAVDNIYEFCEQLQQKGVTILRPPRDGRMAFIRSPDNISIELLQKGAALSAAEPWMSMPNVGQW